MAVMTKPLSANISDFSILIAIITFLQIDFIVAKLSKVEVGSTLFYLHYYSIREHQRNQTAKNQ